ncbi:MAG: Fe(3+) ABC transporter substrate-binding protein [Candidatus Omnitrophota bacterium]|nr:Fe(3+) ABC transporter substrate-binding protein [Candidatus Omnitrophota bacterium]
MFLRVVPWVLFAIYVVVLGSVENARAGDEIVVYSARNEHLIKPLFDAYTAETGIEIKYITDKAGPLLQRLKAEGADTPADLFIAVDAGNLWQAAEEGLLSTVDSTLLNVNVPAHLRDPDDRWFGLSVRARTIVYNPTKVRPADLSSYEALAEDQWVGRVCLRTSKKEYNQSLVAMMIADLGEAATEKVVRGWIKNLATDVFTSDTTMMESIAAGQCDVGIGNTYYFGRIMLDNPKTPLALFWPNQKDRGVHVNISGAGIARYAKHPEEAQRFLEWLSSIKAQNLFADGNLEYPVNPSVEPHPIVASWGDFKESMINVSQAGELQSDAVRLMDRAGYA